MKVGVKGASGGSKALWRAFRFLAYPSSLTDSRGTDFLLLRASGRACTSLSTPLFHISPTMILAGLYTNKSNSFDSKSHMYRARRFSPNSFFVIYILHGNMSASNSSWT